MMFLITPQYTDRSLEQSITQCSVLVSCIKKDKMCVCVCVCVCTYVLNCLSQDSTACTFRGDPTWESVPQSSVSRHPLSRTFTWRDPYAFNLTSSNIEALLKGSWKFLEYTLVNCCSFPVICQSGLVTHMCGLFWLSGLYVDHVLPASLAGQAVVLLRDSPQPHLR